MLNRNSRRHKGLGTKPASEVCSESRTKADEERAQKAGWEEVMSGSNQVPDNTEPWFGVWILF